MNCLLVPMELTALVVGRRADPDAPAPQWCSLAPDYTRMQEAGGRKAQIFGPDLVSSTPCPPLQPGVHLHWMLPEAFGHVVVADGGAADLPTLPNRWLVWRVRHAGRRGSAVAGVVHEIRGWIVASDLSSASDPLAYGPARLHDMGQVFSLDDLTAPLPQACPHDDDIRLTAMADGTPAFAAHYPACRRMLGFHDADPAGGDRCAVEVSYLVAGWCSEQRRDPLHGLAGPALAARLNELQWHCADPELPSRVLCHGALTRVAWDSDAAHCSSVPTVPAAVSVGDTLAEALAALLAGGVGEAAQDPSALQRQLVALQYDLAGHAHELDDVGAALHRHRFARWPGDNRHMVQTRGSSAVGLPEPDAPEPFEAAGASAPRWPQELTIQLEQLNLLARKAGGLARDLASLRQACFTTWGRWAQAQFGPDARPGRPSEAVLRSRSDVVRVAREQREAELAYQRAKEALQLVLASRFTDLELVEGTEAPFYRPLDPVVVVAQADVGARHVADDAPGHDEALGCRRVTEIVSDLPEPDADPRNAGFHAQLQAGLIRLSTVGGAAPPPGTLGALVREMWLFDRLAEVAETRRPFDPVALARWAGNPWRPLFLDWELLWQPEAALQGKADIPASWSPKLGAGGDDPPAGDTRFVFRDHALLGPQPEAPLRSRLEALAVRAQATGDGGLLPQLLARLARPGIVAQTLGGFHDALLELRQGLQLPPIDPASVQPAHGGASPRLAADAQQYEGIDLLDAQRMLAPNFESGFHPLRAGCIRFARLSVVDSFGQVCHVIGGPFDAPEPAALTLSVFGREAPIAARGPLPLPLRYAQPAHLDFRWTPVQRDGSPLAGWIFVNRLDGSLMLCNAAGQLLGALQLTLSDSRGKTDLPHAFAWTPVPGPAGARPDPADIDDSDLLAFKTWAMDLNPRAGELLMDCVQQASGDARAAPSHDPRLALLVGKPLALARASLRFALHGVPACSVADIDHPTTRAFERVRVPVQLDGAASHSGGLVGYFVGSVTGAFHPRHAWQSPRMSRVRGAFEAHELTVNAQDTLDLVLLLDPTGPVHADSEVLPRQALRLPADVSAGLERIHDVFFQAAPLLGPADELRIPRPSDDYGHWSWAVRPDVTGWREQQEIAEPGGRGGFGPAAPELQDGWLKLVMHPVRIAAFWVKPRALAPGAQVTLGWVVEGAQRLSLALGDGRPTLIWDAQAGQRMPEAYTLPVDETLRVTLIAEHAQGYRSTRQLQITV